MEQLEIHHAAGVTAAEIEAFRIQIPEQFRGLPITIKAYPEMQKGHISATPVLMKQRGLNLINKK